MRFRRKTPEEAKAAVMELAKRHHRPIMIGEASVMLGTWSLEETESLMGELVEEGRLRKTTEKECWDFGCSLGYVRCKCQK